MALSRKKPPPPQESRGLQVLERRYERLRRKLAQLGYLAGGTISQSRLSCGQPSCRCHKDPRHRHGPYSYWTTKVKGKTVSRLLSAQEAELYRKWIDNRKRMDQTIGEMLEVSRDVAAVLLPGEDPFIPGR